jgi:hypothetical protein
MQGGLIPSALRAVGEGLSANQWAAAIRESGAGIRRQVALRIYGQARALAAEYGQEPTRPSSGVLQTVQLFYRERVTGNIVQRFFNVKTTEGITREEAISQAIGANSANAQRYEQELIGAVHTGTALLVPQSAA